jgi:predicted DsbA family dithiol-disulfide isomerase
VIGVLVEVWIDFLCPWAYLGQDRSELLAGLGLGYEVRSRPFELHPEIPTEGRRVEPGGRLSAVYERIGKECAAVGLPFRPPDHVANTRVALEWSEGVAACDLDRHPAVVAALMAASFADGLDVGDVDVVRGVISEVGVDVDAVAATVERGGARASVDRSMDDAREIGVAATPAWRFPSGFVLPGVQPREQVERWARRLAARASITPD